MIRTFTKIVQVANSESPRWRSYVTLDNFDTYIQESSQWNPPSRESIINNWKITPENFKKCEEQR